MQARTDLQTLRGDPEQDPRFEMGGAGYRLMQRVGLIHGVGPSVRTTAAEGKRVVELDGRDYRLELARRLRPDPRA